MGDHAASRAFQWLFSPSGGMRSSLASLAIFICNVIGLIFAGVQDNSFFLDGDDRGVFEHPGAWAIIVGDLLLVPSVYALVAAASKLQRRFPAQHSRLASLYLRQSQKRLFDAIFLKTRERTIYIFIICVALLFWANNALQTLNPLIYYRHNLFDSVDYIHGYIVMRVILLVSWVLVMPYAIYVALSISFSIYKIFKSLQKKGLVVFRPFHPDDCGGFSFFGTVNTLLISSTLVAYLELIVVLFTHRHINPGLLSGFLMATCSFLFFSFFMLIPVQRFLFSERRRIDLRGYKDHKRGRLDFKLFRFCYIKSHVSFSPYNLQQKVIVFVARSMPVVISASRYLLHIS
jgi:hypothetical protein